ncbi:MAG: mechanosensitive ion channel family protein [Dehalococcoidia bacterium]
MPEAIREHSLETVSAFGIIAGALILWRVLPAVLRRAVHLGSRSTRPERERRLADALGFPLGLFAVTSSVVLAVRLLPYANRYDEAVERVWAAATLALLVLGAQRLISAQLFRPADGSRVAAAPLGHVTPLARRTLNVAILLVGALLVLDQLGLSISPLLAGLGITGLAVALALQPLLTNLFAGSYVLSDSSIRERDYIEMLNGPSGYVTDIGWRATRLRGPGDELVIVPNATLAASVVTNHGPGRSAVVSLSYPVPYGHALERVQQAAEEEARALVAGHEGAARDAEPVVRFRGVTDSRLECTVEVRASSRSDVPQIRHELLRRLHDRFQSEGFNAPPRSS